MWYLNFRLQILLSMKKDKENIRAMFDSIAPRYDLLNHLLSMGIDRGWRSEVVRRVRKHNPSKILDMATGTADLAIALALKNRETVITGGDLSTEMLTVGREKVSRKSLTEQITLCECDALAIPFTDESFDVVTCAFGVRNFENLETGLSEMYRVTKNGGKIFVLEFSKPKEGILATFYLFYFRHILPLIGRMVSRDDRAYSYLPDSVLTFPYGDDFVRIMSSVGYNKCKSKVMSFGIATIYEGEK